MLALPRLVVVVVVMVINIPVSSGCYNKKHRLGSSKQQKFTLHYCGGRKSKIKVLAGLASCGGPSPGLGDAHLVLLSSRALFSVSVSKFPLPISTLVILD